MNSGEEKPKPAFVDDPKVKFLFDNHPGLVDPGELARLKLWPEPERVHRAMQLLCLQVTFMWGQSGPPGGVQFGFEANEAFDCRARLNGPGAYDIIFSLGLFQRSLALFRKLSLANAFGKYSQTTALDVKSLGSLLAIPGIGKLRAREAGPSIDSLLNIGGAPRASGSEIRKFIARPPVDSKHKFDIQTLLIPSLVFAYWHELGHIIHGHVDWIGPAGLSECAGFQAGSQGSAPSLKERRALEYWADDFAARRVALEILRSANKEKEHYVLAPFLFNRENFNTFGLMEGLPGEELKYNLEGFMYRIAFGLCAFLTQFEGFFDSPHQDRHQIHPHSEVRLSHIVSAIYNQLNAGQDIVTTEFARMWGEQFGYAIHTLEQCLLAHGAARTPVQQGGGQLRATFHLQEVMARAKKDAQEARAISASITPHHHRGISDILEPMRGLCLLPNAHKQMMAFDVR